MFMFVSLHALNIVYKKGFVNLVYNFVYNLVCSKCPSNFEEKKSLKFY